MPPMLRWLPGRYQRRAANVFRRHGNALRRRFQAAAFATLYGPGARGYDRFTDWLFLGEWQRWQDAALADLPALGLIVELGAGTGVLAAGGARPGCRWLALDCSAAMIAVARRRAATAGFSVVRADARALPLPSGVAAAVVATFPTANVVAPSVAVEIRRVLRPDGEVVIVLSGELTGDDWPHRWRRWAFARFYGRPAPPTAAAAFALPGFLGTISSRPTAHGVAVVFHGKPA